MLSLLWVLAIILSYLLTALLASSLAHSPSTLPSEWSHLFLIAPITYRKKVTVVANLLGIYTSSMILLCPTSELRSTQPNTLKFLKMPAFSCMLLPPIFIHKLNTYPGLPLDLSRMAALPGSLAWCLQAEEAQCKLLDPFGSPLSGLCTILQLLRAHSCPLLKDSLCWERTQQPMIDWRGGCWGRGGSVQKLSPLASRWDQIYGGAIHVPGLPVGSSCSNASFLA